MAINGHTLAHHHTEFGHCHLIHMQQILTKFQASSQGNAKHKSSQPLSEHFVRQQLGVWPSMATPLAHHLT